MTLRFEKRDSAFRDLEDVYDDELFLGSVAPAQHGRKDRDWCREITPGAWPGRSKEGHTHG